MMPCLAPLERGGNDTPPQQATRIHVSYVDLRRFPQLTILARWLLGFPFPPPYTLRTRHIHASSHGELIPQVRSVGLALWPTGDLSVTSPVNTWISRPFAHALTALSHPAHTPHRADKHPPHPPHLARHAPHRPQSLPPLPRPSCLIVSAAPAVFPAPRPGNTPSPKHAPTSLTAPHQPPSQLTPPADPSSRHSGGHIAVCHP